MEVLKTYSVSSDTALGEVDIVQLESEIKSSGFIDNYGSLSLAGDDISIIGDSVNNQAALDSLVSAHSGESLDAYKELKNLAIDAKTVSLIYAGFTFDGQIFSMSDRAQTNWIAISANESLLSWPLDITTKDDSQYSLTQANAPAFYGSALMHKQTYLNSGRALKLQVNAEVNKAGVDSIEDNR